MTKTTVIIVIAIFLVGCSLGEEVGSTIDGPLPEKVASAVEESPAHAPRFIDLDVRSIDNYARAGERFTFSTRITSRGTESNYQVKLSHDIKNKETGEVIVSKEETVGIEIIASKRTEVMIPKNAKPGRYIVETKATYESGSADASFEFDIEPAVKVTKPLLSPATIERVYGAGEKKNQGPAIVSRMVNINITGLGFVPLEIVIKVGTWVKWTNVDTTSHTATGAGFNAVLRSDETYLYQFNETRVYSYTDTFSGIQSGTISVEE